MADVVEVDIAFPERGSSSYASSFSKKKPMARMTFLDADGDSEVVWVPVRVARTVKKNALVLPVPSEQLWSKIHEIQSATCLAQLTDLLARRDYGTEEARRKLQDYGYRVREINEAIDRAKKLRYLSDTRFVSSFIEQRKARGWGRKKIELDLRRRSIDLDSIPGYPEAFFNEDDDLQRALGVLSRKRIPEQRAFQKLMGNLMTRGFSYAVASEAVRSFLADHEEADV